MCDIKYQVQDHANNNNVPFASLKKKLFALTFLLVRSEVGGGGVGWCVCVCVGGGSCYFFLKDLMFLLLSLNTIHTYERICMYYCDFILKL